ncbi:restriction endonuclease subunit S [Streptococcus suis]
MKDSGIEWIGEVPEEWGICRIKDIYSFFTGTTPDTGKTEFYGDENGSTWITISDMQEKYVRSSKQTLSELFITSKLPMQSPRDSLLYSFKLSVGKVSFAQQDLYTNEAIATFLATDKVCLRFLYYSSFLIEVNAEVNIYGAKILNRERINNAIIINPPLLEQTQIADFLDKKVAQLDKVKSLLEEQIKTLEDYRQSLIYETVTKGLDKTVPLKDSGVDWIGQIPEGWEVKNFKYVATIKDGTHDTPEYFVEGVPLITSKNLDSVQNRIDFDSAKNISYDDHIKISQRSDVKKGDILMPMIGTVGGATQVLVEKEFSIKNVALFKVAHDEALSRFLYYQLNSRWTNSQLSFMMSGGVQSFVSLNMLSQVKLIIPTSEEIKKINLFLDSGVGKINQMIAIKKEQIDNINKQRQTLIYDYVTGKRRV